MPHARLLCRGLFALSTMIGTVHAEWESLFDGRTFAGWKGDTETVWRIEDGVILGGSMEGNPQNEFLATERSFDDFHLKLEYRLVGTEGFVNGGVQFRSVRIEDPANEMEGYQADIGAGYSGFLYDESRRRRFLAEADAERIAALEKPGEWNRYEIHARGRVITLSLNGQETLTYLETDLDIPQDGKIALQIHGACRAVIAFRNLTIEELPPAEKPSEEESVGRLGPRTPAAPLAPYTGGVFELGREEVIAFIGQENLVRERDSGALEARLTLGYASQNPVFRSMAWEADTVYEQWRDLNFGDWSAQLEASGVTTIMVQFGQMEALDGPARLSEFTAATHRLLDRFAPRTRRLVILSPMPFERPMAPDAPDLRERNADVSLYTEALKQIAQQRQAVFVDLFSDLQNNPPLQRLTDDGIHLTETGLEFVATRIAAHLGAGESAQDLSAVKEEIVRKNRLWFDLWRPANWSFVYGDRVSQAYGQSSSIAPDLQTTIERQLPQVQQADQRIHDMVQGKTPEPLPPPNAPEEGPSALSPEEQLAALTVQDGFEMRLFASEAEGVVNPTQIAWDPAGRLYVACSPSYPQTHANAPPRDYILVLEDIDADGRADAYWRWAEGLRMVQGVEPGAGGVFVCDFDQLIHLSDTDGDHRADTKRVLFSGFGVGDTHQLINSVCYGPHGDLWFGQGLHAMSRVETPWGITRLDRAGLWRLNLRSLRLEGFFGGGMAGANTWGIAFDDFGQVFHNAGDRPEGYWSVPGLVRGASPTGSGSETEANASYRASPEQYHGVGGLFQSDAKTTSIAFVGTDRWPEDMQGDVIVAGYFASTIERHRLEDKDAGFASKQQSKLVTSTSPSFRPVDVSFGPDGALYIADWYNPVIGHYQASYADPKRDRSHGRIWTLAPANSHPPAQPDLESLSWDALAGSLRSPERWVREMAKRRLFDGPTNAVTAALETIASQYVDPRFLIDAAGVRLAHGDPSQEWARAALSHGDPRVRSAGARLAGLSAASHPTLTADLRRAALDPHPRVRVETIVASTYIPTVSAIQIALLGLDLPSDSFIEYARRQACVALRPVWQSALHQGEPLPIQTRGREYLQDLLLRPTAPNPGSLVYTQACLPCHQPNGTGLPGYYPPLVGSPYVRAEDPDNLVRIVLHGLEPEDSPEGMPDSSPKMPSMMGMSDTDIATALTYIREVFGDKAPPVSPETVTEIREKYGIDQGAWTRTDLLTPTPTTF